MPKKAGKWEKIAAARALLGLEESASLNEVRLAYRRRAKEHHPDTADSGEEGEGPMAMHLLNEAYRTIVDHCQAYPIPLEPGEQELEDDEDWWMKRFGRDPLWGKSRG